MKRRLRIENLECSGCAAKMEDLMLRIPGVTTASINMSDGILTLDCDGDVAIETLRELTRSVEPDVTVSPADDAPRGVPADDGRDETKHEAISLVIAAAVFAAAFFLGHPAAYAAAYAVAAYPVLRSAAKTFWAGNYLNEFTLMSFASLAAIAIDKFPEAVSVMLFYRVGEFLQERAASNSRRSIKALAASKPAFARLRRGGAEEMTSPELVREGDIVIIRPGEKIPVDGEVIEGVSSADMSSLTGESEPVVLSAGDRAFGGALNIGGLIAVRSSGDFEDSTVARIMDMVENAISKKSKTERFITAFARYYTPAVVSLAAVVAVVPPLLGFGGFSAWLYKALVMLVISCPCALVISIPLGYFGGIGAASRRGILVKGGGVFDAVTNVKKIFFDKTGTLTEGVFTVTEIDPAGGVQRDELARSAAMAESLSNHPIARSIANKFSGLIEPNLNISGGEEPGMGVSAVYGASGKTTRLLAGNLKLMASRGISAPQSSGAGAIVHVAEDENYLGSITVSDRIRAESRNAIERIRENGIGDVFMLTGDREKTAEAVAGELNLSGYRAELMPDGKVAAIDEMAGGDLASCMFVGDGANDGPVLASVGTGVAMGGLGSEIAVEAADAVILDDSPSRVADLLRISRFTRKVVWQNIFAAMS
ncbi:MAG: heavy metal translocating P-type ATPase, partial [Synergistaceae bacterium]|nr:heavy metal translocating P-type ATPase [Synergistaceae bacterium]